MDIELTCRNCGVQFWICGRCFRGHVYCSRMCRSQARSRQFRQASKKYQDSPKGRENHRQRQKHLRNRSHEKIDVTVTHQSSAEHRATLQAATPLLKRCVRCGARITVFARGLNEYIMSPVNICLSLRLHSIRTLLENHPYLMNFLFLADGRELRATPADLICSAGNFSHGEIVLILIALDIWCGEGSVTIDEAFVVLDRSNWQQFVMALAVLGQVQNL